MSNKEKAPTYTSIFFSTIERRTRLGSKTYFEKSYKPAIKIVNNSASVDSANGSHTSTEYASIANRHWVNHTTNIMC